MPAIRLAVPSLALPSVTGSQTLFAHLPDLHPSGSLTHYFANRGAKTGV